MFSSQEFNLFYVLNEPFWMKQFVKAALEQQYIAYFFLTGSQRNIVEKTRKKPSNNKREKKKHTHKIYQPLRIY